MVEKVEMVNKVDNTALKGAQPDKPLLLVLEAFSPEALQAMAAHFTLIIMPSPQWPDAASLAPVAGSITAIATAGAPGVPQPIMDMLPNLKMVAVNGVGTDAINLQACKERGIAVSTTQGLQTDAVADMAMALLLAVKRHVVFNDRYVREGLWATKGYPPLGSGLAGNKLGLVGYGTIGQAIAERARAFRMEVGYFCRHEVAGQKGAGARFFPALAEMASWCDDLVLILPGGPATQNLVDGAILRALGAQGCLVNVARGSVVDEPALLKALQERTIMGAGLDVFWNEPDINKAFFSLDNVVLSPHQGSATIQTRVAMARNVLDNLLAFFADRPLLTPVKL
ncbi:2-hydroxyacid dehydrogenase [Formicincola oecophyllae]|nr:2-hydroxyacid dehydrogenase [Formicincola oecophyllae]